MCESCGGTCGSAQRRQKRITFDVKVNGRTVFVRDGKMRTFDRMPIVAAKIRDTVPIGGKLEWTSERFLLCHDVPLARTGDQIYLSYEVPGLPAKGGQIVAQRDADQVFDNAAIESFRGKPFTDDHPFEDVTPANFKEHMIGTVMNPRRGTGDALNHLLGDILVYDAKAADDIWNRRKTEVSAGYSCDYEVIAPGRARQIGIRGNHVSLVDAGRCGPTCAIRH